MSRPLPALSRTAALTLSLSLSLSAAILPPILPAQLTDQQDPRKELLIPPAIQESMELMGEDPAQFEAQMEEVQTRSGTYTPEDLYQAALENSKELQKLMIDRNKASLDAAKSRARRFPTLDMETNLTWIGNPLEPISVKQGEFGSYEPTPGETVMIPPEDVRVWDGMESTLYEFTLIMEQPLFTWGKISNAIDLRKQAVSAADLQIRKKEKEIETRIHTLVHTLSFLEQIGLALQIQQTLGDRLIELAEKGYENGMILSTELMETRVRVKEISLGLRELEEQQSQLLIRLRRTTGLKELEPEQLDYSHLPEIRDLKTAETMEEMIQEAFSENIDLMLLRTMEGIREKQLAVAAGAATFKPDFGLHMELSYSGQRFPFIETDWYGQNRGNLTATLGLQTPLFDAGKRETERMESRQNLKGAQFSLQEGRDRIEQFIRQNALKRDLTREQIQYQELKGESIMARIEQKRAEWEAGYGSERDYLKAQLDYYQTRIEGYRRRIDCIRNYYELQNVLNRKPKAPAAS